MANNRHIIIAALAMSCGLLGSPQVAADTLTVCNNGCDFTSINAAIAAANRGDVIQLSAQTYFESQEVNPTGKAITLRGAIDVLGVPTSVLDGANSHRVLACYSGETTTTRFENLVIRNGYAAGSSGGIGGGMYNASSSPTISNCRFVANRALNYGGGMHNYASSPVLVGCSFIGNSCYYDGGGINNFSSSPSLVRCTLSGNSSGNYGAGIYNHGSTVSLIDCSLDGNICSYDGNAIFNYASHSSLNRTLVCNNGYSPIQVAGSYADVGGSCVQASCNSCSTSDADSDGVRDEIDNCPNLSNPNQGDCDLDGIGNACQIAAGSPDVNANSVPDSCECLGDLSGDGVVNGIDLAYVLTSWGVAGPPGAAADIDGNGLVNGIDLAVVIGRWGPCD